MFEQSTAKQPHFLQHFNSACSRFAASHSLAEVARATGIGEQVLRNKLNPEQPHQLTTRDLVQQRWHLLFFIMNRRNPV
ncbi:phage regulatory CII family protein [Aeromonas bestiarum]|uniref:phage regulatory CII family protein n=1 Tax=Aeromonas bestiarum TaxID=105751 RepID=UPI0032B24329